MRSASDSRLVSVRGRLGDPCGQAAVEYAGVLIVVALVILTAVSFGWGTKLMKPVDHAVRCVFSDCAPHTVATPGTAAAGPAPVQPAAPGRQATPPVRVVDDPVSTCGTGGTPMIGPLPAGEARPCVSTATGLTCTPEAARPPLLPTCVSTPATTTPVAPTPTVGPCGLGGTEVAGPVTAGGSPLCVTSSGQICTPRATPPRLPDCAVGAGPTPSPASGQSALPTPDSPWALSNDGSRSCPAGYDFHVYDGVPWCGNSTLDLAPGKLDESPWETNRNDYEPGSFNLYCGSGGQPCTYTTDTPWKKANAYYLCYDEGGTDCEAPDLLPVVGTRVPGDDPNHPAHGFQVFPGGRQQQLDYNQILEQAENLVHGVHESQEQKNEMEERLEEWAYTQVDTPAWYSANDPGGAPEGDPIDEDPVEGEGE